MADEKIEDVVGAAFDEAMSPDPEPAPEPEPEVEAAPEAEPEPESEPERAERERDEQGRFKKGKAEAAPEGAKKAEPSKTAAPAQGKAAGAASIAPVATPAPEPFKAPQSWKPQMRELAAKLPPEFRPIVEEALRRDGEINKALQETAQARQIAQQVQQALAPYETVARARGTDAMSLAGMALQTVNTLQFGNPQQKAQELAGIIRAYGVDVEALAAALDGQPQQAAPAQAPVNIQAEVQRAIQAQVQQAQSTQAEQSIKAFLGTNPEFVHDVAPQMVAVFQASQANGQNMTPEQAYEQACWMNPDVRAILQQRQAAEAAKASKAAAEKARAARQAVPKPSPAPASKPASKGQKVEDDVRASMDELEAAG